MTADRWQLNLCVGDQCELFDLNSDPYEFKNLFDDPKQKDGIRTMGAVNPQKEDLGAPGRGSNRRSRRRRRVETWFQSAT